MKNLKRLGVSATLIFVLSVVAFAGETQSPPCAVAQMTQDDSLAPGETSSPSASNAGDASSVTEAALDLLQTVLSLF
jgi:hypothetical protein